MLATLLLFCITYLIMAWYVSQDATRSAFGAIHGYRIFNIDDAYRRYLASSPLLAGGLWTWNFYLPGNLVFDGFFSWLTGHSEFWMRVPHLLANLASLWLVYRADRHLNIHAGWLLLACCTLLWMPLYALVSMSFYGESLLAPLMGIAIYALASQRPRLLAASSAAMPFIRPEGAFYLGFLGLQRLWQKRFRQATAMLLPAVLYFLLLMLVYHFSIGNYWQDRSAFSSMYAAANPEGIVHKQNWLPYITINPLWWLLGLAGGLLPSMKRFRPLFLGAITLMIYWWSESHSGNANGEARYYLSLMPLFALSQAALLSAIAQRFIQWKKWLVGGLSLLILLIGSENLLQLDPIRNSYFNGNRYPVGQQRTQFREFIVMPDAYSLTLKQAYAFVCAYTNYDPAIDRVVVNAYQWFNKSDVCTLPNDIRVELSFLNPEVGYQYLNGYIYSMFPANPHYTFYHFYPAPNERTEDGKHYALYVTAHSDVFPGESIQPLFTNQVFNIYKLRYRSSQHTPFYP